MATRLRPFAAGWEPPGTAGTGRPLGAAAGRGHLGGMNARAVLALAVFLLGFLLYVGVVVALADHVLALHWAVQAAYFVAAGILWVFPTRRLMIWAAASGRP